MSQLSNISIVIPFNGQQSDLHRQLKALSEQRNTPHYEVIVADNRHDTTSLSLEGFGIPIRVINCSQISGSSYARNMGAQSSNSTFILFTDADDICDEYWVGEMVRQLSANRECIISGAVLREKLSGEVVASVRLPKKFGQEFAATTNLGLTREVFDRVGGFNLSYIRGQDVDFSWRAREHGIALKFLPSARVTYSRRSNMKLRASQNYGWGCADALLFRDYPRARLGFALDSISKALICIPLLVLQIFSARGRSYLCAVGACLLGRLRGGLLDYYHESNLYR